MGIKSVEESVIALEKLLGGNKFIEESDRFYKEKDLTSEYTNLENSQNKSIDDFIKTLPQDISYNSEFDESLKGNLDESDYIMERINQMDNSVMEDEETSINIDGEEGSKKKFK